MDGCVYMDRLMNPSIHPPTCPPGLQFATAAAAAAGGGDTSSHFASHSTIARKWGQQSHLSSSNLSILYPPTHCCRSC